MGNRNPVEKPIMKRFFESKVSVSWSARPNHFLIFSPSLWAHNSQIQAGVTISLWYPLFHMKERIGPSLSLLVVLSFLAWLRFLVVGRRVAIWFEGEMVARLLGDLPRLFLFWLANVQVLHHIAMMGRLPIGPSSKSKTFRWVAKSRSTWTYTQQSAGIGRSTRMAGIACALDSVCTLFPIPVNLPFCRRWCWMWTNKLAKSWTVITNWSRAAFSIQN